MIRKIINFLASMKLAVLIMAAFAALLTVGTLIESQYDAWVAKNWVYNTMWMYVIMTFLATSLIAVMVDRWPWKIRHLPFILAHVGILFILYGAMITLRYGVDGTLRLSSSGEAVHEITLPDTQITVFRSRTGDSYEKVYSEEVNFLKNPIRPGRTVLIKASQLHFELLESIPFGVVNPNIQESVSDQSGSGLRFQLANKNVREVDWLYQRNLFERAEKQIGPVFMTLGGLWKRTLEINEIRFFHDQEKKLNYVLYDKEQSKPSKMGVIREGESIETGWMGLELTALRYLPRAQQVSDVRRLSHPTPLTRPSVRVRYNGLESFLVLNDYIKVFTDQWVYLIAYTNKKVPLGFDISLKQFRKTEYPGSARAMFYQSEVIYDGGNRALISMNEPLKHKGFYLYQASFEEADSGPARASILSVNHDPGRSWKYVGSLMMSVGIVLLFWFKRKRKNSQVRFGESHPAH